jgi:hypothetical protein
VAQSFTVGDVSQTLASVTLRLQNQSAADETVTVNLFSNNSGKPGSSLLTFGSVTVPVNFFSFTDFMLSAPSVFTLQANTTYWLEAETSNGVYWSMTGSTASTGPGTLPSFPAEALSPPPWGLFSFGRLQMEVDGAEVTATPEPASLTLLGTGAAGMVSYGWRRRKRATA